MTQGESIFVGIMSILIVFVILRFAIKSRYKDQQNINLNVENLTKKEIEKCSKAMNILHKMQGLEKELQDLGYDFQIEVKNRK